MGVVLCLTMNALPNRRFRRAEWHVGAFAVTGERGAA